jgi:transcriptional regulator with XRE-family HTH domain
VRTINAMRLERGEHGVYCWLVSKVRKAKGAKYRVTYIRDWREFRGLTLREVENRMEKAPGEPLITGVSIGRIERGLQPYTQPILEALAVALDCEVSDLLERNPKKEGEVIDLMRILRSLDRAQLGQVTKIVKAIA